MLITFFCYLGVSAKIKNYKNHSIKNYMKKSKILIADSDVMLLSMLKFRLEQMDFEVVCCDDGREAQKKIESDNPDLIVCEMMLPSISGSELITYVKNDLKKEIPIIVLTSAGIERVVLNAFSLGAEDFVSKPFSPNELIVRITKAIKHNVAELV